MKELTMAGLVASLFLTLAPVNPVASERASANKERNTAKTQTLFECRTDLRFALRRLRDGSFDVVGRRSIRGKVRLVIDTDSHLMKLLVESLGEPTRAFTLSNVEQGSSLGSGASGRADTTIRGKSRDAVLTLFAGYENNTDQDAALQVTGHQNFLLACSGGQYSSPGARGLGRYGFTNIYILSADGLANEMSPLPDEPDFEGYP